MSEVENEIEAIDPEVGEIATVGHPEIDSPNPIADLIDKIGEKDYTSAEKSFQDVMQDRVQDVLDQVKFVLPDSYTIKMLPLEMKWMSKP